MATTSADRSQRLAKGLWWERAWTLVEGCSPVSPGCRSCWSAAQTHMRAKRNNAKVRARYEGLTRDGHDGTPHFNGTTRLMHDALITPLGVKKPTVWAIWNDLFHPGVSPRFIHEVTVVMARCPHHKFIALTKRPVRAAVLMSDTYDPQGGHPIIRPPPNLCIGTSVESQNAADIRIPMLLECHAALRCISVEPLLERVDLQLKPGIDWVIVGCESGRRRRLCEVAWVRDVVDQCRAAAVRVFVKQIDFWGRVSHNLDDWPDDLRVRELPAWKEDEHGI